MLQRGKEYNLVNRRGMLQVNQFPVPVDDTVADHPGRPALLRPLVGIESFRHASAAIRSMRTLETTAQAGVAVRAVAKAIARQLIQHTGNSCRCFVGFRLDRLGKSPGRELFRGQYGSNQCAPSRRRAVIRGNGIVALCSRDLGERSRAADDQQANEYFHSFLTLPGEIPLVNRLPSTRFGGRPSGHFLWSLPPELVPAWPAGGHPPPQPSACLLSRLV